MTKKYLLFVIIFLMSLMTQAQKVNGFMGKNWDFYLDIKAAQTFLHTNKKSEKGVFKYDYMYGFGVNRTMSKSISLGLDFQMANSKYTAEYHVVNYEHEPLISEDLNIKGLGAYIKFYTRSPAPLGYWVKLQTNYYYYTAVYKPGISVEPTFSSGMYGFQLGLGRTYIYKEFLTISPCLSFGFSKGEGKLVLADDNLNEYTYETRAERKVREMGFINIGLAIGLIPF